MPYPDSIECGEPKRGGGVADNAEYHFSKPRNSIKAYGCKQADKQRFPKFPIFSKPYMLHSSEEFVHYIMLPTSLPFSKTTLSTRILFNITLTPP